MDNIRLHTSCDTLSIYSFHKIMKEKNYAHLIVGWDEYEEIEYDENELKEVWDKIYIEYCDLTNDNQSLFYYQLLSEINYLEVRKYVVLKLLEQLMSYERSGEDLDKYIEVLRLWKYTWDKKLSYEEAILKIFKDIKASDNKIRLKKDEIGKMKSNEDPMTLTAQVVKLELSLEKNHINPKTTSVLKWVVMLDEVRARVDAMNKRKAA